MAGTRGGNRNIFGRIDLGIPTCSMALTPRNHYSLSYNIVLKNLKCSAPFYEAPIRHESCQTTHLEAQSQGLAVPHKVDLVFLALQLFLVARIGFRAVSRVLSLLAWALGIQKAPCPQTVINWVTRLAMVRTQSARLLEGLPLRQAPFSNGLICLIDSSIGLGTGKILAVLAVDAHHHQLVPSALS